MIIFSIHLEFLQLPPKWDSSDSTSKTGDANQKQYVLKFSERIQGGSSTSSISYLKLPSKLT
jgi:hypothetical protein